MALVETVSGEVNDVFDTAEITNMEVTGTRQVENMSGKSEDELRMKSKYLVEGVGTIDYVVHTKRRVSYFRCLLRRKSVFDELQIM